MVLISPPRTVDICNQKMEGDEGEDSDNEEEDQVHKEKKMPKKKNYATPVAEFIDVVRDKMKLTVREFKFEPGQSD